MKNFELHTEHAAAWGHFGTGSSGGADSQLTRGAGGEMPAIPGQTSAPAKYAIRPLISLHSRYF